MEIPPFGLCGFSYCVSKGIADRRFALSAMTGFNLTAMGLTRNPLGKGCPRGLRIVASLCPQ
jgi:hypothetical protein